MVLAAHPAHVRGLALGSCQRQEGPRVFGKRAGPKLDAIGSDGGREVMLIAMKKLWSIGVTLIAALCGCGQKGPAPSRDLAVAALKDDPILEAATRKAQDSLPQFTARLKEPAPSQSHFSVKVAINSGGMVHYLWLLKLTYDDGRFSGVLGVDARGLDPHHPGEMITMPAEEIYDWMYVDGGKLVGGYSLRALRDQLSGKQREAFEKSVWFSFD